jgi:hypothetical protein
MRGLPCIDVFAAALEPHACASWNIEASINLATSVAQCFRLLLTFGEAAMYRAGCLAWPRLKAHKHCEDSHELSAFFSGYGA